MSSKSMLFPHIETLPVDELEAIVAIGEAAAVRLAYLKRESAGTLPTIERILRVV